MENKTFIGIALCILFYLGYTQYLQKKYPSTQPENALKSASNTEKAGETKPSPEVKSQPEIKSADAQNPPTPPPTNAPAVKILSSAELTLDNKLVRYAFNQDVSALSSITLKKYQAEAKSNVPVELLENPLVIQAQTAPSKDYVRGFEAERKGERIIFSRSAFPWAITEEFQPDADGYGGTFKVTYKNLSDAPQELNAVIHISEEISKPKESSMFFPDVSNRYNALVVGIDGSRTEELVHDQCEESDAKAITDGKEENIDFIGFDKHYFLKMIQPKAKKFTYRIEKLVTRDPGTCPILMELSQAQGQIAPSQTSELEFRTYFGPKEMNALAAVDDNFIPALSFGWVSVIAKPLLAVVKGFYRIAHNYGIAIIILTILLKILFYPLTRAAAVSMKNMQKYNPELARIREKFKEDKALQQKEIMAFMSKHKINPAKGCLPILPQIPVFIAFYNVLSQSVELRHAPFMGWIQDLSAADPYYISPLLLGLGMFVQQKLTPTPSMDKTQQRIMLLMPVMFTAMMLTLPAGLVLYMIVNTIVSIAQQQWLNKKLGISVATPAM